MKRLFSLLLAGILIFSLVPAQVLATEETMKYDVGATLTVADSTDPNMNENIEIPEKTKWIVDSQRNEKELNCDKEHAHDATCGECLLEPHTHVWNCPADCDKAHTHTPEECCKVIHDHSSGCNCLTEVHSHTDSCYTGCTVHTCTVECQIPEGGTCPNIHTHTESCQPTCAKTVHTHSNDCCNALHEHGDQCSFTCGIEEHTHITDKCDESCSITEHTHGDSSCKYSCGKDAHTHNEDECYVTVTYTTWELVEVFTVTFDLNGATGTIEAQPVANGGTVTEPTAPTREGYIFDGWYTEKENPTNKWNFASTDSITANTVSSDITLYAKWLPAVTVQFDVKQGTPLIDSQTIAEGSTATKPDDPSRGSYEFGGWYDSKLENKWNFNTPVTKNMTLYAGWLAKVTIDSNNGSEVEEEKVLVGKTFAEPAKPSRENCTFVDWCTDPTLKNKYVFSTAVTTHHLKLYAKWNATVTFNSNGGSTVASKTVVADSKLSEADLPKPTREGYVFRGWYKDDDLKTKWDPASDTVTGNLTLHAMWKHSVEFNTDGGTEVETQYVDHNANATKPADPVKTNKVFDGWYEDSDFDTPWNFNTDKVDSNTTLYAKWKKNPLIVSPADKKLYPGESATFTAKFNGTAVDNDDLNWSVTGIGDARIKDTDTKISTSGKLTIGEDETPKTLIVTATIASGTNKDATDFVYVKVCPLYEFKSGTDGKWSQKSVKSLTFAIDSPYSNKVTKVLIGTKEVKSENYTVTEATDGTTKLTLKANAMKNLSVKEYDLTVLFEDEGKAETTFKVIKASDIPETGDSFHLPLWVCLMAASAAAVLLLKKRRA